MRKITLKRPKETFNLNRSYEIFVNNNKLAELKNGEEKTLEIPNELQNGVLRAKIDWCGSEEVLLSELNGASRLSVSGNKLLNSKFPLLGIILPIAGVMTFSQEAQIFQYTGTALIASTIATAIWMLTFGRNSWLALKKLTN